MMVLHSDAMLVNPLTVDRSRSTIDKTTFESFKVAPLAAIRRSTHAAPFVGLLELSSVLPLGVAAP